MYLYQAFDFNKNAINIDFSKGIADLWRICTESLDLTYKLIALKTD